MFNSLVFLFSSLTANTRLLSTTLLLLINNQFTSGVIFRLKIIFSHRPPASNLYSCRDMTQEMGILFAFNQRMNALVSKANWKTINLKYDEYLLL